VKVCILVEFIMLARCVERVVELLLCSEKCAAHVIRLVDYSFITVITVKQ